MDRIVHKLSAILAIPVLVLSANIALARTDAHYVEPKLHIAKGGKVAPQVALTLDACSGQTDLRILNMLVENRIPATIFVTGRWLRRNAGSLALMKAHPDLFELENHGLDHVPAIDNQPTMFGLRTAGSLAAVRAEIEGGEKAMTTATLTKPAWYRDATARYSNDAITLAHQMGYRVAGYSLNADAGASLLAGQVEKRIAAARDGDVIIAHINQPTRASGEGVVKGILALKQKGFRFVRLEDVEEFDNPVQPGV
ncbi:polysaccharide deacetylase family protein [Phyllobacterium lublinensis]|uniref:polysaccharide deacetylase family protein n=1 Tax=Phyllobacterium lublinensis TaxID=2875708 RepID=UPI001CCD6BFE|nr:polysaccharide deacetylase family protein [Phyllobacterium sp. 2063]MBZ9654260.1 polysaccharide deacetylase family protein [Phyllobacterium sp. 2063]